MKVIEQRKWLTENKKMSESPKEHYREAFKRIINEIKLNRIAVENL